MEWMNPVRNNCCKTGVIIKYESSLIYITCLISYPVSIVLFLLYGLGNSMIHTDKSRCMKSVCTSAVPRITNMSWFSFVHLHRKVGVQTQLQNSTEALKLIKILADFSLDILYILLLSNTVRLGTEDGIYYGLY